MATKKTSTVSAPRVTAADKKWQAQSDLRTMQEASQIQSDKRRMTAAQKEAQNQMAALNSIAKKK
jgi:hypothetical protein